MMASQKTETDTCLGEQIKKVNLDTILIEDVGQFGMYQFRIMLLTVLFVIMVAFAAMEFIFTTARIRTRCLIPECESAEAVEFSPRWLLNAVPPSGDSFDNCRRYGSVNGSARTECPADWFTRDAVVPCSDYVYENTDTIVYHFGLACDEWRRSIVGSIQTIGGFASLPITGFISDRWGRRFALSWNAVNIAWWGTVRCWITNYYGFLVAELVKAALGAGGFSCAYILIMELVGPKYRVYAGATINTCFAIGQIFLGLIAWAIPNWRNFNLALYVPQFIVISYFWLMSESVRWYMSKGRYNKATEFLKNVARVNKRELSEKSLRELTESAEAENKLKEIEREQNREEPWLIVIVFQNKEILKRCCVSPVWWVAAALIYNGLSINAVNMSGNRYVNLIASAASEIPGFWVAVVLMNMIGRKPVLVGAYWICAACQLVYVFIPDSYYGANLSVYLVGKFSIAAVMASIYIYTSEIYPTKHRHSLFAFSSMIGRVGAFVAPLTPVLGSSVWQHLPSVLFGAAALVAGALVFLTPETLGSRLPDTMEEASAIGARRAAD